MKYDDLTFLPHPLLAQKPLDAGSLMAGVLVEKATIDFPNGWTLLILRNMKAHNASCDFETSRTRDGYRCDPRGHFTIEEVQAEIDAVEAMDTPK